MCERHIDRLSYRQEYHETETDMDEILQFDEVLTTLLYLSCYTWAINKFCKKHFEITAFKERIFVILLFISMFLAGIVYTRYSIPHIIYILTDHLLIIALVLLFFEADTGKKIFAASVLIAAQIMLGNFCESSLCCLALFLLHTLKGIAEPFLSGWHVFLIDCVRIAAVTLAIYGMSISRQFISVFRDKTRKWYVVSAIPLLTMTVVIDVASWGATRGILVRSGGLLNLYYDQLFSHAEFCILAALAMFASGFYVLGMNRIDLEQRKNGQYHSQITSYQILWEQYSQAERLRHDMQNHIIALSGLLENKDFAKMGEYLKNMESSGKLGGSEEISGNKVVDALLYQKKTRAEQTNTLWECDVQMPKICYINEFDLCILFGNILDNAIKACEKLHDHANRFINIQAKPVKHCFLLEVKNGTDTANKPQKGYTNKENLYGHGLGLLNVGDVVHKYNGVMNIEVKDGVFTISLLIPMYDATVFQSLKNT